jgi:RNA polymerase sigma factor (sigma-70 family)
MRNVIETLRRVAARQHPDSVSDADLLERFIAERDEIAFEGLVRRHGPMVLGVCRRILGHVQDAEDAFQATFLVLVRKAPTVAPREQVGNWLYGVAQQTARKARSSGQRRQSREQLVAAVPESAILPPEPMSDVMALVDRELAGLPATYRAAIVLCDLEGRSGREAARLLGWPEGTLFTRLTRGRKLLADRLGRRGVDALPLLPGPVLGPALVTTTVQAASATALGPATAAVVVSPAVASLTEGVLQAMIPLKFKFTAALVVVASLVGVTLGAGGSFILAPGTHGPAPAGVVHRQAAEEPPARTDAPKLDNLSYYPPADRVLIQRIRARMADDKVDTETLIRRVYLDLTGQLPEPEVLKRWLGVVDPERLRRDGPTLEELYKVLRAMPVDDLVLPQPDDEQKRIRLRLLREKPLVDQEELRRLEQLQAQQEALRLRAVQRMRAFQEAMLAAEQQNANQRLLEALVKGLDEKSVAELMRLLERRQAVAGVVENIDKAAAKVRESRGKEAEIELLEAIIKAAQERKEKAQKQPAPQE